MEVDPIQNVARTALMRLLAGPWSVTGSARVPAVVVSVIVVFQEITVHVTTVKTIDQVTITKSEGPEGYQK